MTVTVSGVTKELLEYHNLDDSLMLNPQIAMKEPQMLLSIPDERLKQMDLLERYNLLSEFTASLPEPAEKLKQRPNNE